MNSVRTWWLMMLPGLLLMLLLFILPMFILVRYSFYQHIPGQFMQPAWVLDAYTNFLTNAHYRSILIGSLWLGIKVVFFCILLGYPVAYLLVRKNFPFRQLASSLVVIPLLTSPVVTAFGWVVIVADSGLLNQILLGLGLVDSPLRLMFNETGVMIALIQSSLPFMILSVRAALGGLDRSLEEAAGSLGASPYHTFLRVTLPLSLPGVFAGSLLVFISTISAFVTPILLGGGRIQTLASLIYSETLVTLNWPIAAAASIIMLVLTIILLWGYGRLMESKFLGGGGRA
ncbi:ABC transporter permease [Ammoniphilus sp. YIM 78166]|uniref:ABC transporter permease n=1 Tax=Ammoniphilus sp. YIM 78166 TaxID=1644106 RepID=UPI00106F6565|nr:ABC transporter permease [Ammoniphilus sp. YIM 78166]